jgi:hypothetical protein
MPCSFISKASSRFRARYKNLKRQCGKSKRLDENKKSTPENESRLNALSCERTILRLSSRRRQRLLRLRQ